VLSLISTIGHATSATLFATLAVLVHQRMRDRLGRRWAVAAALTALSALVSTLSPMLLHGPAAESIMETVRNGGWLLVVSALCAPHEQGRSGLVLRTLPVILATLLGLQLLVTLLATLNGQSSVTGVDASWLLRCTFSIGALFYLQRQFAQRTLSGAAIPGQAWLAAALTVLWVYDFNHYLLAWLTAGPSWVIGPTRGFVLAVIAPLMALSLFGEGERPARLSRPIAMRLVSAAIILVYFGCVLLFVVLSRSAGQSSERLVVLIVLFALSVAVLVLLPPTTVRSWLRVAIAKHLFAHRYDYRAEWMRFAATVAQSGQDAPPLERRVARAMAQVIESPAAILLLREDNGSLKAAGDWNWPSTIEENSLAAPLATAIEQRGWIVDIAADKSGEGAFHPLFPAWLSDDRSAWVIAPLIHRDALLGVVILARPAVSRRPDWEDLDVLRVVGTQAAATISEARGREALDEAQRFDEFNRRFAFILHDLKNLVSQMSLLASNAERHADNPDFRKDMIFTLKETAGRMTEMLARLGRSSDAAARGGRAIIDLRALAEGVVSRIDRGGGVIVEGAEVSGCGDADALSRALDHLVRNAMEAANGGDPVRVVIGQQAGQPTIQVIDKGVGMSPEFIRNHLFRPFSSTKNNGFGLGAHEARLLIRNMGGSLAVESQEGAGTQFTVTLLPAGAVSERADRGATPHEPEALNMPARRQG
jgi:putative PEP-CTERM system histidine kinase